jgi:hypothetical protein
VNSARFAAHERIVQFHNLYVELTSAVAEQNHALADERLGQMADIAGPVQRDLNKVGQGMILMRDAPALGGRQWNYQLTDVVLTPQLATNYNIDPQTVMTMLRKAAGEYRAGAGDDHLDLERLVGRVIVTTVSLHIDHARRLRPHAAGAAPRGRGQVGEDHARKMTKATALRRATARSVVLLLLLGALCSVSCAREGSPALRTPSPATIASCRESSVELALIARAVGRNTSIVGAALKGEGPVSLPDAISDSRRSLSRSELELANMEIDERLTEARASLQTVLDEIDEALTQLEEWLQSRDPQDLEDASIHVRAATSLVGALSEKLNCGSDERALTPVT